MTNEEAGINAVKQALYYIILRDFPKRQNRIAVRLYNVYGFGYESAHCYKDMMWSIRGKLVSYSKPPDPTLIVPPDMKLDEVVDTAWSFYRRCQMDEATAYINAALSMAPDKTLHRRLQRLQGMICYFKADFEGAALIFPQPLAGQPNDWWARDKLTLAGIFTRLNRLDEATREIADVAGAGQKYLSLLIAIPACEAMVMIMRGQIDSAKQSLVIAFEKMKQLYATIKDRRQKRLGDLAYFNPSAVHEAAFDTATGFVMTGDLATAIQVLSTIDENVFPPNLFLLENDPALEPLRMNKHYGPLFFKWLTEAKEQEGRI